MLNVWLTGLAAGASLMVLTWIVSVIRKDASLVDRVWGLTFVVYAWTYVVAGDGYGARGVLVATLVTIWGVRLSGYITWRNWGDEEDKRYQAMRRNKPETFAVRSLFTIFLGQGVLAWLISVPLLAAATSATPDSLGIFDYLGIAVWAVGFYFEAVGDYQLAKFLGDDANRGKVMNKGLWRYTRHPNYFGDTTVWVGYFVIALATGAWWAIAGPILMGFFLVKVSGVRLTEKNMAKAKSKREGYDEYLATTSAFFPRPPKKV